MSRNRVTTTLQGQILRGGKHYEMDLEGAFTVALDRLLRRRLDARGIHGPVSVRFPDGSKVMIT